MVLNGEPSPREQLPLCSDKHSGRSVFAPAPDGLIPRPRRALLMVCERQGDHVIPLLLEPHDDDALSGPARGADAVHRGADQDACLGHQQQVLRAVHHLDAHHGAGLVRHHVVLDAEAAPVGDPIVLHRRLLAVAVFRDGQHRMIDLWHGRRPPRNRPGAGGYPAHPRRPGPWAAHRSRQSRLPYRHGWR